MAKGKGKHMKQAKKKKRWIAMGAVVILVAAAAFATMNTGVKAESAAVDRGEVTKLLKETASVESKSAVTVSAKNSEEVKGLMAEEGDSVKAGDLLMAGDGTSAALDIKSRKAELSGLQAQYQRARDLAGKNRTLYEQGALSYENYNASDTAAKQLASQIASLQYSIESYRESSGASGVTAPVDGILTGVYIKEGEMVTAGQALFEISNLNDTYVKADFIAEDADLIREGDAVRIYNKDANFSDGNGTVKKVYLKAEEKMSELGVNQKRVTVEISFGAADKLRLGSDVDVEVTVDKKENVIRVPELAIFEKAKKDCVYVIEDGKARLREIKTGLSGEDYKEVVSGLSEGDKVIMSPGDDIADGMKVKIK
jgi:HlyD family secretion protein